MEEISWTGVFVSLLFIAGGAVLMYFGWHPDFKLPEKSSRWESILTFPVRGQEWQVKLVGVGLVAIGAFLLVKAFTHP